MEEIWIISLLKYLNCQIIMLDVALPFAEVCSLSSFLVKIIMCTVCAVTQVTRLIPGNNNNNTNIYKAHNVSIRAESEAPKKVSKL